MLSSLILNLFNIFCSYNSNYLIFLRKFKISELNCCYLLWHSFIISLNLCFLCSCYFYSVFTFDCKLTKVWLFAFTLLYRSSTWSQVWKSFFLTILFYFFNEVSKRAFLIFRLLIIFSSIYYFKLKGIWTF